MNAKPLSNRLDTANERTLFASVELTYGPSFAFQAEFALSPGITILFGASGAGKTTLLDCLAGLARPERGRIVAGDLTLFDDEQHINLPPQRRHCGYLFQTLALFPHMTVRDNVEYGLSGSSQADRNARSQAMLESFRVAHLAGRKPESISGGERQRVALARALVTDPLFLLLDEPLTGLDAPTKGRIIDDLRDWNRQHGIPILFVTHDRGEAFGLGDRVLVLEAGRIVAEGTPHEVLDSPRRETVAQLAGFENVFEAIVQAQSEEDGTMTCRLLPQQVEPQKALERFFVEPGIGAAKALPRSPAPAPQVSLEVPLSRVEIGQKVHVGVRAGDILVAVERPAGLSARNLIAAKIVSIAKVGSTAVLETVCVEERAIRFTVHLTHKAVAALQLSTEDVIWLVLKTHSCHVMQ